MFFETTLTAERIAALTADGVDTDRLLNDIVDDWAEQQPNKTAIVDVRSRYGYGELRARADTAALGFLDCGLLVLDELPMTPSGKVQKLRLRELATEGGAGRSFATGC